MQLLRSIGHWATEIHAKVFRERPLVLPWLLHKLYPSRADVVPAHGTVNEGITVAQFDAFLRWHHRRGMAFIGPDDLLQGQLDTGRVHVLITFDDGYRNNLLALDVLAKYRAKATFHISTDHVKEQRAFWWDAVYREMSARNVVHALIMRRIRELKTLRHEEQERQIAAEFGAQALDPVGDQDRPMTADELRVFAQASGVSIGSHTHRHLSLPMYSDEEIAGSLRQAWQDLVTITGRPPVSLAYPYGHWDPRVATLARDAGHRVMHTYDKGRIMDGELRGGFEPMLPRNNLSGHFDIATQCRQLLIARPPAKR